MAENKFRHEQKYEIDYLRFFSLKQRIKSVMKRDPHTQPNGTYQVSSIYFDNFRSDVLKEKINGKQKREKFRIRFYQNDRSFLTLEKKQKINDLTKKISTPIEMEEVQAIFQHRIAWMEQEDSPLLRELYYQMRTKQLRPCVFITYEREPYVYPPGNVRVTFDYNIRTQPASHWMDKSSSGIFVNRGKSPIILEVKYDEYLPEMIALLLQEEGLQRQSYSKYAMGRCYI